ncbi:MAG: DNA recombination protein RmuC [Syntrophales bacterium]|nr:DNA recombination protein RmuC [Syntrophales bacterium]
MIVLIFIALRVVKDAPDRTEMVRLKTREQGFLDTSEQITQKTEVIEKLLAANATLEANLKNERIATTEKINILKESESRLKTEFENLANRIFEDKGKVMTDQNSERITGLLQPFKEQLESFRQRVDEVHNKDTEHSSKLLEQIRQLQELSNKVSDEANNLATAIKGESKRQGDWGELILERIFEACGLERGREYDVQVSMRAEDGSLKRPDFIVYLPGNKGVIIDSKVSLTAFERYSNVDEDTLKAGALNEHLQSVRRHVSELKAKDYSHLLGNKTLDFVIMCIPLEPAYQTALCADANLLYDFAKTNVVITGPTTLMITLKLIAQIWRREHENRNAEIIADKAGRMYDQVVLICESMIDAQKKLGSASEAFDLTLKRLKDGKGNLVGRVEEIRRLGAKVNKQLPAAIVEE